MEGPRTIARAEWRAFFDRISDTVAGKLTEIEAASLDLGDQVVAEGKPLLGMTYDSQDDLLDIALGGLNHLIRRPREIYVQEGPRGVESIAVVTDENVKHILKLKAPLMIPAPSAAL